MHDGARVSKFGRPSYLVRFIVVQWRTSNTWTMMCWRANIFVEPVIGDMLPMSWCVFLSGTCCTCLVFELCPILFSSKKCIFGKLILTFREQAQSSRQNKWWGILKIIFVWVKCLNVVAKCSLNWVIFTLLFIVVLGTHMKNIKMRSSKLFFKSTVQKVMAKTGCGHKFHDLKYFDVGLFFSYSLNSL